MTTDPTLVDHLITPDDPVVTDVRPSFDAAGDLPDGLVALEASAGTGKTYALSALALRFVAERGIAASELCIVSFAEAATAELRGRVRERLVGALAHLESGAATSDDAVLRRIADVDEAGRRERTARLRLAVAEFDSATIATIHGFCSRVIAAAGGASDGGTITAGSDDVAEVVNDVLLARHADDPSHKISPGKLEKAVLRRLGAPDASLFRGDPPDKKQNEKQLALRKRIDVAADLIDVVAREVVARRAASRRRTFDGLLTDARDVLRSPASAQLVKTLRSRYRVVLIDEFQDTDRVQWDIFRTAFVAPFAAGRAGVPPSPTVVLVGDPKQSIYRFRSAELSTYLDAVGSAGQQVATLSTNYRTDDSLLSGLERLLRDVEFGDESVRFQRVTASATNAGRRLEGDAGAALQLRCVPQHKGGVLRVPEARRAVRRDVVDVVIELLHGPTTLPDATGGRRRLHAGDIAVITRTNAEASTLALSLAAAGIPAATAASNSVLDSDAAHQWRVLLQALERPAYAGLVRAAALGWFIGMDPSAVDAMDDDAMAELHDRIRRWTVALLRRGLPGVLALARADGLHLRLLSRSGGERDLTDVDHVAELLQRLTGGRPVGASALLALLSEAEVDEDGELAADDALARRIDRDDDAVQLLTVHKAKGLEFPVVLCPFLWTVPAGGGMPHAHDAGTRWLDASWVAGADKQKLVTRFRDLDRAEAAGEARRVAYVALTWARHRCIVWWASCSTSKGASSLSGILDSSFPSRPASAADFEPWVRTAGNGTVSVTDVPVDRAADTGTDTDTDTAADRPVERVPEQPDAAPELVAATATRVVDRSWRVWSFSSIKAGAELRVERSSAVGAPKALAVHDETVSGGGADEPTDDRQPAADGSRPVPPPATGLTSAPGGTTFGTLVHHVLEKCDFAHPELEQHLTELCADALRYRVRDITPAALAAGLAGALSAPLGGPAGAWRLRDLARADRLDELEFTLPVGRLRADDIGRTLAANLAPDDPLLPWARSLGDDPAHSGFDIDLHGRLTGSIDLVARTSWDSSGVFWVADYKTNQLGVDSPYDQGALVEAMSHHQYALQATLYLVAMHRYLRWRLPGYRPEGHLGGAAYLFVRGMEPGVPAERARGVFWWQPAPAAIVALDRLLAGAENDGGGS